MGKYVQNGDIQEWQWDEGEEPEKFVGVEPDFDPTSAPEPVPSPAEGVPLSEAPVEEEVDLESLSKAELVDMAADAGLDTSGTKADLVERLAD